MVSKEYFTEYYHKNQAKLNERNKIRRRKKRLLEKLAMLQNPAEEIEKIMVIFKEFPDHYSVIEKNMINSCVLKPVIEKI